MPVFKVRSALTGIKIDEVMHKIVKRKSHNTPIFDCIRSMIKMRNNIILIDDKQGYPAGVVTKTDIMTAYYSGIPVNTALSEIMMGPLLFCFPDDRIEDVIDSMRQDNVQRVLVCGADNSEIIGMLDYSDIIGLLYRYCRDCDKSKWQTENRYENTPISLKIKDAMTEGASSCSEENTILNVIEELLTSGLGSVLIVDDNRHNKGVISKTDLNSAYLDGISPDHPAKSIMSSPVISCKSDILLTEGIQQMLISDVQQLYVQHPETEVIEGQLSISRAARQHSGTCRACITSLMLERV